MMTKQSLHQTERTVHAPARRAPARQASTSAVTLPATPASLPFDADLSSDTSLSSDNISLQSCGVAADDAALTLNNQLCFALYSASLAMTRSYRPMLDQLGLTYSQYIVMLILWEQDGCSLKEIADRLFTESGALTPVLKRMQQMGLLLRARSAHSERTLEIRLTEAGRALKAQARKVFLQVGQNCGLPVPDIVALRTQLVQLRQQLLP
jgi:DNA-binding MarR family transcriptional regulator